MFANSVYISTLGSLLNWSQFNRAARFRSHHICWFELKQLIITHSKI